MMVEFAHYYGSFPAPDAPWSLFLSGYQLTGRFEARHKLSQIEAVGGGIGSAFGGRDSEYQRERALRTLLQEAYPVKLPAGTPGGDYVPNMWPNGRPPGGRLDA